MQTLEGIVKSVGSQNSVIVAVEYLFRHRKYKKTVVKTTKLAAHNNIEGLKVGDKVSLVKTKPYSKTKHFEISKII